MRPPPLFYIGLRNALICAAAFYAGIALLLWALTGRLW